MVEQEYIDSLITPEYLLERGFVEYHTQEESGIWEAPFYEDYRHFIEADHNRNMFVVLMQEPDKNGVRDHLIYVQENAGCGFVRIPERWYGMPKQYFEAIYFGIQGCKPKEK